MRGEDRAAIIGGLVLCLIIFFLFQAHDAFTRPPPKFQWPDEVKTPAQPAAAPAEQR